MEKNAVTGLILAGGAGRRVGGRDKGLLHWHGQPVVSDIASQLRPQSASLIISCNRNLSDYAQFADRIVTDSRGQYGGPLCGIDAASDFVDTEYILLAPCDTPQLPADYAARLLQPLAAGAGGPVFSFAQQGRDSHYLCAGLRTECLASLKRYLDSGQRSVIGWIETLPHVRVDFSDHPTSFHNLNHLRDFEAGH